MTRGNSLRIIGGRWRGRRLEFPDVAAIRPTPDRVRETVFNWLQFEIAGSRCLDLFAGSGALGIEALSRDARHVSFVDREPKIGRYLRATLSQLQASNAEVVIEDATSWLARSGEAFDVVFLDPPFAAGLLNATCDRLESGNWLSAQAFVYIEAAADDGVPGLPGNWSLIKRKTAGQVGYHLARRNVRE